MEMPFHLPEILAADRREALLLAVTSLGAGPVLAAFLALYYWLIDPPAGRRVGVTLAASFAINALLKAVVATPRPFVLEPGVASELAERTAGGGAWPSGHSQNSAAFWLSLAWNDRRRWIWWLALPIVAVVALSRLLLHVHFVIDVVGGLAVGAVLAWASRFVPAAAPRGAMAAALASGGLLLASLDQVYAARLGLLVGVLLASPDFRPPRGWWRGFAFGLGGILLLLALHLVIARMPGGWQATPWGTYLHVLALTLVGAEAWPRLALGSAPREKLSGEEV